MTIQKKMIKSAVGDSKKIGYVSVEPMDDWEEYYDEPHDEVYINGEYLGDLGHSCGPYGSSTGDFRLCETTTPINEIARWKGYDELYYAGTKEPFPKYY